MRSAVMALAIVCGASARALTLQPLPLGQEAPIVPAWVGEHERTRNNVAASGFNQRPYNQERAHGAENGSDPRRQYLFLGGIGSPYLGVQIACIVLAAFGFSSLAGYGLFRRFNYGNRKWRWSLLAAVSGILSLVLWGWAWAGNPFSAWGLAP